MAGYLQKTQGEIQVWGEDPFNNLKVSANMIFIDDNMPMPQTLSLIEILEWGSRFYKDWDMNMARGLLDYFSLDPGQFYQSLSRGLKSTFNVILGIAARCPLTLLDEPTTGMDAAIRKDFYRALLKDYLQHPRTIIVSSHLLNEIQDILEEVLLIKEGSKCLHLPISDLKEYGVGLLGRRKALEKLVEGEEILHREELGAGTCYYVVRNTLKDQKVREAKLAGVEIKPVTAEDLCVYLTAGKKGGIDSVFNGK
ncbi:MAG: ABC transporter ATP-binding protein [Candidatus Syntrophonatronum acetioxidans]|uniref:ABC transporter ATP-binding protein n=1 Tax=Candidatus Syntrophonatronum acetioxidans TaxID=1795816 RepID=A0A424YC25_9FIRM|nr:MAG: ABC transporter ATP-binding protein [Candidatus Syntrophonatronum acetioxidans]